MASRPPSPTSAVRRVRRRLLVAAAAPAGLLAACTGPPTPTTAVTVADRWIRDEPFDLFDPSALLDANVVQSWPVGAAAESAEWHATGLEPPVARGDALVLRPTGPDPRLERWVELDAAEVDVVEVDIRGVRSGRVELYWAEAGQGFTTGRRLALPASHGAGRGVKTFTFPVGLHPEWRGRIARLRLDPASTAAEILHLHEVRAGRWSAPRSVLEELLRRPWKIRIDDDVRTALLTAEGRPWERTVAVEAGDVLRFGFGVPESARTGARFRVEAAVGDGDTMVLLERRLRPPGDDARWHDARLSLDRFAGSRVRIRLVTDAVGEPDPVRDLAAWSDPVLLRATPEPATNVVLICLDTLRADRMSLYGHDRPTTPVMDAWAAERAVVFEDVVAPAPWTLPSHVSLFTGLDAHRHGVNHTTAAPAELDMLAERLRAAGHVTAAVTGGGILRPRYRFTQGFDSFAYWSDESSNRELEVGLRRALSWLDDHAGEPFFLFFHTYEVHYPHRRRQPFFDRLYPPSAEPLPTSEIQMRPGSFEELVFSGDRFVARDPGDHEWRDGLDDDEVALVRAMYDSAVAYADAAVGRLLDRLDRLGIRDRTLVIVLSDHGEALGEDGRAGHSYLEDYNLLVPLVVELPGGRQGGRRVARQVRLVDVAPTVLDALGLTPPADADGVSLLPVLDGTGEPPPNAVAYAASSNRGLALRVDGRLKYVVNNAAWRRIAGEAALFDLEADPDERRSLAGDDNRAAGLGEAAFDMLREHHAGIRLRIANRLPAPLEARLTGAWRDQARVKTLDPACGCARWEPGVATIELAPGREVTLVIEGSADGPAGLEGVIGPTAAPFGHDLDLYSLDGVVTLRWKGDGWTSGDAPLGSEDTGFQLERLGPRPAELSDTRTGADEAIEQLRALGYVE